MRTDIGPNRTDIGTSSTPEFLALDGNFIFRLYFGGKITLRIAEAGGKHELRTVGLNGLL